MTTTELPDKPLAKGDEKMQPMQAGVSTKDDTLLQSMASKERHAAFLMPQVMGEGVEHVGPKLLHSAGWNRPADIPWERVHQSDTAELERIGRIFKKAQESPQTLGIHGTQLVFIDKAQYLQLTSKKDDGLGLLGIFADARLKGRSGPAVQYPNPLERVE